MPSPNVLELIKQFEGVHYKAYPDTGGVPTIGVGHTKGVQMGDVANLNQVNTWLYEDLHDAHMRLTRSVKVPLNQNQFDALISFVFNLGYVGSTMLRRLNELDYRRAANEFDRFIYDNGKVQRGLVRRRAAEKALFLTPVVP